MISLIDLTDHLPNEIVKIIYDKIYSTGSSRIILSKHFPDEILRLIQSKLLPDKITSCYKVLQELINKYYNTIDKQYCLKCNVTSCDHLMTIYAQNYNILRIISGCAGLAFST